MMRTLSGKLYSAVEAAPKPATSRRSRIALTSPLFAFGGAALGSVAVWVGLFKLLLG
jgi:hypothetical protein